jgi:hypothetical protein
MRRWAVLQMAVAMLCASAAPAGAQTPAASEPAPAQAKAPEAPVESPAAPGLRLDPEQRKDPAQFRGRPRETDVVDGLLWIPRVALLPAFAVTELGVRRPVYAAAEWTDRHHVVPILERVFKPTPDLSWFPIVSLDLNVNASFGLKGKWRNMLVPGHDLKASAETGGADNWRVAARDQWLFGQHVYAGARGDFSTLPNRPYYGLGPRTPDLRTNFLHARYEGFLFQGLQIDNHFRVELTEGYRFERTAEGIAPSIETQFSPATIPGFGEISLAMAMLDFRIDSRRDYDEAGGARLLGNVTYAQDTVVAERSFVSASLDFEVAAEVSHPDRVLALRGYAVETVALGSEPVPFTHLATLGGQNHVGFIWGRFRGDTALVAELQYRYPIAYYMDAQWTVSAGNVFGPRFAGLDIGSFTGTLGVGLRTRRAGVGPFEVTFALGTTRFDEPFDFNAVRVYFGTTEGL